MSLIFKRHYFIIFLAISHFSNAQNQDVQKKWTAQWLMPDEDPLGYGVYLYRRNVELEEAPKSCIIYVSGDNRYELFVNGKRVCYGPARSDLDHWQYEILDIAPYLSEGKNVLAVQNWNYGKHKHLAQQTEKTAFILQAFGEYDKKMSTGAGWLTMQNKAYSPYKRSVPFGTTGVEDKIEGSLYPWGWETLDYNDKSWKPVKTHHNGHGYSKLYPVPTNKWALIPRSIPLMQDSVISIFNVRRISNLPSKFQKLEDINIPAHTVVSIVLDHTVLTNAYPVIEISRGKQAEIELVYAECLLDSIKAYNSDDFASAKLNRNKVDNLALVGIGDKFISDGGLQRKYRPLWFRNFRYIEVRIKTKSEPLIIHNISGIYTAYPLVERSRFVSSDTALNKIWQVGFRTARLCAHETYLDCPYYEQLQYIGDTRIQALISYVVSNDDRLAKNAIAQFAHSQSSEGLTRSSWPNHGLQYIPSFSLFWALMLYDYYWYRGDKNFVKPYLPNVQRVIDWHQTHLDSNKLLRNVPHWNFVDWPDSWKWDKRVGYGGIPEGGIGGVSAIVNLQYVYTLQKIAQLHEALGQNTIAKTYRADAEATLQAVMKSCWDAQKGLLADAPGSTTYSQHANLWLVLCDAIAPEQQKDFVFRLLQDKSLIPCTVYYKFYLFQAMKKAGLGYLYIDQLSEWKEMLKMGLTTFAERPEPTRSDCHAWSANPLIDLLATVLGVEPTEPGFKKINVKPNPGQLTTLQGIVSTPSGVIKVALRKEKSGWRGTVELPEKMEGYFQLNEIAKPLISGVNIIN